MTPHTIYIVILFRYRYHDNTVTPAHSNDKRQNVLGEGCARTGSSLPFQAVKAACCFQLQEAVLTQCLIEDDGSCIGKVQRSFITAHGDTDTGFPVIGQDLFRDTCRLPAEHDVVIRAIGYICIGALCLGGGVPELRGSRPGPAFHEAFIAVIFV